MIDFTDDDLRYLCKLVNTDRNQRRVDTDGFKRAHRVHLKLRDLIKIKSKYNSTEIKDIIISGQSNQIQQPYNPKDNVEYD